MAVNDQNCHCKKIDKNIKYEPNNFSIRFQALLSSWGTTLPYVDVANRIYERIKSMDLDLPGSNDLKKEIAINAAIYFEDKMSGIGLWNAFVARHL